MQCRVFVRARVGVGVGVTKHETADAGPKAKTNDQDGAVAGSAQASRIDARHPREGSRVPRAGLQLARRSLCLTRTFGCEPTPTTQQPKTESGGARATRRMLG